MRGKTGSSLGTRALKNTHVLPLGHLELRGVLVIQVKDLKMSEFVGSTARLGSEVPVLLPDEALQEGVVVCGIVFGGTPALAVPGIEILRFENEAESLYVPEHNFHLVPAASLTIFPALSPSTAVSTVQRIRRPLLPGVSFYVNICQDIENGTNGAITAFSLLCD
jgi:hypothetical protein